MGIYGSMTVRPVVNEDVALFEATEPVSFESFIEACYDSSYFLNNIMETYEIGELVTEAEGAKKVGTSIKEGIQSMLHKIEELWKKFIGVIKEAITNFKESVKKWYEEHNIYKGVIKGVLKGWGWEQIDEFQKSHPDLMEGFVFLVPRDCRINEYLSDYERWGVKNILSKEIKSIENNINNLQKSIELSTARDLYSKIIKDIDECADKIKAITVKQREGKDPNQRDDINSSYKFQADYHKDKSIKWDRLMQIRDDIEDSNENYYYTEIKGKISKDDFNKTVKFIENCVKRSHEIDNQFYKDNLYKYAKKHVDSAKESLKNAKKYEHGFDYNDPTLTYNLDYNNDTVDNIKYKEGSIQNSKIRILSAKCNLQLAQLEMKIYMGSLKAALKTNKSVTMTCLGELLVLRIGMRLNEKGIMDDEGNYVPRKERGKSSNDTKKEESDS